MAEATRLTEIYRPTHDENARHGFVGALKSYVNGDMEQRLAQEYEERLKPRFVDTHGREPVNREEGTELFRDNPLYQLWGSAVFTSQNLMWDSVGETCDRLLDRFEDRRDKLAQEPALGKLEIAENFTPPEPIRSVEIHRQPGGYFGEPGNEDLRLGMNYFGTIELYRAAKGLSDGGQIGEPNMGRYLVEALNRRYPDIRPVRILDMGCGPGIETVAYKEAFPDAEVWGVDLSAPFVRFGHVWAEDRGLAINYRQANAADTGFEDESFDLILSHIMFHETWHDILPAIMAEARRLLRPGGVFINGDTPYQPERISIPKQVTNHWQVVNNGEPFWTGYADTDIRQSLVNGGFNEAEVFADYDPLGQGEYYVFGAKRAAS